MSSNSASFTSCLLRVFCADWRVSCVRSFLLCICEYFFALSGGGEDVRSERGMAVCCETEVDVGSSAFLDGPGFGRESCRSVFRLFDSGLIASAFAIRESIVVREDNPEREQVKFVQTRESTWALPQI